MRVIQPTWPTRRSGRNEPHKGFPRQFAITRYDRTNIPTCRIAPLRPSNSACGRCSCCSWCWGCRWRCSAAWGIVVFGLVVGLASYLYNIQVRMAGSASCPSRALPDRLVVGMLLPAIDDATWVRACLPAMQRTASTQIVLEVCRILSKQTAAFRRPTSQTRTGSRCTVGECLSYRTSMETNSSRATTSTSPGTAPNNRKLLASRPEVYACPDDPRASAPGSTPDRFRRRGGIKHRLGRRQAP